MPETLASTAHRKAHLMPPPFAVASAQPLRVRQTTVGLLNLRGNTADAAWVSAVEAALGTPLALSACTTQEQAGIRTIARVVLA